jgi:hypothetical protein
LFSSLPPSRELEIVSYTRDTDKLTDRVLE